MSYKLQKLIFKTRNVKNIKKVKKVGKLEKTTATVIKLSLKYHKSRRISTEAAPPGVFLEIL